MVPAATTSANQQGFVLIMGMALMVALTVMAIPMVKMATLQEKMAGIGIDITQDLMDAETSVSEQEQAFAALTDLSGETLVDDLCGIKMIEGVEGGSKVRTHYYSPPPNGFNWGDGDGTKVAICHKDKNDLSVSINAVGDEAHGHMSHEGDYLGYCSDQVPDDPWATCIDKFGDSPKRLSWVQLWDQ